MNFYDLCAAVFTTSLLYVLFVYCVLLLAAFTTKLSHAFLHKIELFATGVPLLGFIVYTFSVVVVSNSFAAFACVPLEQRDEGWKCRAIDCGSNASLHYCLPSHKSFDSIGIKKI